MNPELQLLEEKIVILNAIKKEVLYNSLSDDEVVYHCPDFLNGRPVGWTNQTKLLRMLEKAGAFVIVRENIQLTSLEYTLKPNVATIGKLKVKYLKEYNELKTSFVSNPDSITLSIEKNGNKCYLLADGREIEIKRLQIGRPADVLLNHLLLNPGQIVQLNNLKFEEHLSALTSTKDLTEVIRYAGFNKKLKSLFFPVCTKTKVKMLKEVNVNQKELTEIEALIAQNRDKS